MSWNKGGLGVAERANVVSTVAKFEKKRFVSEVGKLMMFLRCLRKDEMSLGWWGNEHIYNKDTASSHIPGQGKPCTKFENQ